MVRQGAIREVLCTIYDIMNSGKLLIYIFPQGSQIRQIWRILRQNCSDDSTEVTEGVTSTPEIFANKQGATSTPEICGNKHSFVLTFFTSNTIHVNCKRCKP